MSSAAWVGWVLVGILTAHNADRARKAGDATFAAVWGVLAGAALVTMLFITAFWAKA